MLKLKHSKILFLLGFILVISSSCRKDTVIEEYVEEPEVIIPYVPTLPSTLYDYEGHIYPSYFTDDPLLNLLNTLDDGNQVTNEGATLGRVLFYDKNLSMNNTISCASCHHQDKGFADGEVLSEGFEGGLTGRNSMGIVNINFQRRFFWDQRANSIEDQVLMPIEHPIEMGMQLADLENKLTGLDYYKGLFIAAFGDELITSERIALALAQFLKAIRSYRSKYDKGMANNFADFTPDEELGRQIYFSGEHSCVNCHTTPNFGGVNAKINGLEASPVDLGIGGLSGDADDMGKFKSVSLRNIELTAPYMHDGRFATLEEVIDFYSTDIQAHPYLDDHLAEDFVTGGTPKYFDFPDSVKVAYVAFLKTLTDWDLVDDIGYSNPFPE